MPSLIDLRRRIRSVKNTQQITKAMKMVAAAKLKRTQDRILAARPYALKMRDVIRTLSRRVNRDAHPLLQKREGNRIIIAVVTSDRGLCGAFNAGIIREAQRFLREQSAPVELITVGRKARDHFQRLDYTIAQHFTQPSRDVRLEEVSGVSKLVIGEYGRANFDQVFLAYAKFISVLKSQPTVVQLLPFVKPADAGKGGKAAFEFEPNAAELLNTLLPQYYKLEKKISSGAKFIINHPRLPADKIPYWDFDAPGIPDAPRDASAAACAASCSRHRHSACSLLMKYQCAKCVEVYRSSAATKAATAPNLGQRSDAVTRGQP